MLGILYRAADAVRRRSHSADHGRIGEDLAHRYLRAHGCTIVARNYRPRSGHGEIDLVVWHGGQLVFVEVKTRASAEFGEPEGAVDSEKQRHLLRAAGEYARRTGRDVRECRFDVVAITLSPRRIAWRRDAFR